MDHKTHIVIFPSPGISHLIPFIELAKRLVSLHNFHVTCLLLTTTDDCNAPSPAKTAILDSLPAAVDAVFLPPVSFDDLPEDYSPALKLTLTVTRSLSSLQTVLESQLSPLSAFIADPFGFESLEVAKGLNVPSFIFFSTNAMAVSLIVHLPKLDEEAASVRFLRDLPDLVRLPGCVPLHGKDLIEPLQDRESQSYESFLKISKGLYLPEGIIINSFLDMESEAIKALEANEGMPRIFPVGPIVQIGSSDGSECLTWLDQQPCGSVLYVSFGSGGTLSSDQLTELAFGLEMSGQRFLWVARKPNNESSSGAYLKEGGDPSQKIESFDYLPDGFLERTKGRGLVVQSWVPQAQVLSHGSTGGFVSHCGWSSVLESVVNGVPLIAWPLYAEQKMNAVMLVDGLQVALRPRAGENGVVGRDEVARAVKVLMEQSCEEGKKVGNRMNELKEAAAMALGKDGSSTRALSDLASMFEK
ncbi:hydroquinone glucosyltransferase-like [Humulus lupulus]|uniref:hydroquinone glucosyltransferase-like n=1 Tax=Humulus lupulus TaxID=3486 RepID=UPI002B4085E5|nr:hydroquinone glucosyltransferase-like [Humulus lupulus]